MNKIHCAVCWMSALLFVAGPFELQAQINSWNKSTDGLWADNVNWSSGTAPSNDYAVYITNGLSKTVLIDADTPAGNLTITNLYIWSTTSAYTNTLLLSSNSAPLIVVSNLYVGTTAKVFRNSALTVDGGTLSASNAVLYVGPSQVGDNSGRGLFSQSGGTCSFKGLIVATDYNSSGRLILTGGLLVVTNGGGMQIGRNASGIMTQSGGKVITTGVTLGSSQIGDGSLVITGGTNINTSALRVGNYGVATNDRAVGTLFLGGGLLTMAPANGDTSVGFNGIGTFTQTNGVANLAGAVSLGYSDVGLGAGTINISGGTNNMGKGLWVGLGSNSVGTVWLTGGNLNVLSGTQVGHRGVGTITVSNNAIWTAAAVTVGNQAGSRGTLNVVGGSNIFSSTLTIGNAAGSTGTVSISGGYLATPGIYFCSNGTTAAQGSLLLSNGGVLEANNLVSGPSGSGGFRSQNGGVLQFTTNTPAITNNSAGSMVVTNAVISYRNVTAADIYNSQVSNITFQGANTFRLNNATNASSGQAFTFANTLGGTNFANLELYNGSTYRGGAVTIGSGGSLMVTNGTSTISSNLIFQSDSTYHVRLGSTGTYDRVSVGGTVTLGGALDLQLTAPPVRGFYYTLIDVAGSAPSSVSGSWSGTATASYGGTNYVLSVYTGRGDGNDVVVAWLTRGTVIFVQ